MFGWMKKLRAGGHTHSPPLDKQARAEWIKAQQANWQVQWHDLFDADPFLGRSVSSGRPDPMPDTLDDDYRLIFDLSQAHPKTQAACFAVFPQGTEMHARFDAFRVRKPVAMSETAARQALAEVIALVQKIGPNEDVDFSKVEVVDRDTEDGLAVLSFVDEINILLEESLLEPRPVRDMAHTAAERFLREPLYAMAGNYYQLHTWVTGVLIGGDKDLLFAVLYEMWHGGWQVFVGDEGVVLAKRRV